MKIIKISRHNVFIPVSSDEVQEKDDSGDESMEDVDDFFWRPPPPDLPPRESDEARALLKSGGEVDFTF